MLHLHFVYQTQIVVAYFKAVVQTALAFVAIIIAEWHANHVLRIIMGGSARYTVLDLSTVRDMVIVPESMELANVWTAGWVMTAQLLQARPAPALMHRIAAALVAAHA